ncbi:serine hydrolase [Microbacterium sp. MC2]
MPSIEPAAVRWSVHAFRVDRPEPPVVSENPDLVLPSASTAKILVLLAAALGIERGELRPGDLLDRDSVAPVADSGIWQHLDAAILTLHDVATLVGMCSDNLATNVLIAHLGGLARVAAVAEELGITGPALHDIVRDERTVDEPPTLSTGSARGYATLMARLVRADGVPAPVATRVLAWLSAGVDHSMVAAAFGLDPLAHQAPDRGFAVINKTGTDAGVRVDAGVITAGDRTVAYACLAHWPADERDATRDQVLARMRDIGERLRAELESGAG